MPRSWANNVDEIPGRDNDILAPFFARIGEIGVIGVKSIGCLPCFALSLRESDGARLKPIRVKSKASLTPWWFLVASQAMKLKWILSLALGAAALSLSGCVETIDGRHRAGVPLARSEEHTSELQSQSNLV